MIADPTGVPHGTGALCPRGRATALRVPHELVVPPFQFFVEFVDTMGDGTPFRIEAASLAGRSVWFTVIGPWASSAAERRSG